MTDIELACKECGSVIVLVDPPYDLILYPLCTSCRARDGNGCDQSNKQGDSQ